MAQSFELTQTDGNHVQTFETFEAAEKYAHTLLGVRNPYGTGPHVDERDGHTFHAYYMSKAHARAVEADAGEGGLQIHTFDVEEA